MTNKQRLLLFPHEYRVFPHQRTVANVLRAMHILCFSILVGGLFFDQPYEFLFPWTMAVIMSGLSLFAIDLFSSCIALFEIRGVAIVIKVLLLLFIPLTEGGLQLLILFMVVIFASLISHASRSIRHFNIMPTSFQQKYGFLPSKSRMKKTN
ncbi:MAG: Unknown protein [uncultured Thiotrichaceae bacterium]|uniref:Uncharacterized protein n=1 Tax=uncultured Thiotrichaceae bacterium TaxID=298394 RepID=A0A6S6SLG8_9GAMM|nr:MAG: Unknown protein [uncultured Thiotrichaceae bacterium]